MPKAARTVLECLLAFLLVAADLHACTGEFVLPDGRKCDECRVLLHHDADRPGSPAVDDSHGDCHDCCDVRACDGPSDEAAAVVVDGFALTLASPPAVELPAAQVLPVATVTAFPIEECPPTGPPAESASRAPPIPHLV